MGRRDLRGTVMLFVEEKAGPSLRSGRQRYRFVAQSVAKGLLFVSITSVAAAQAPRTIVLRGELLARTKTLVAANDPSVKAAFERLKRDAAKQMAAPIVAVTDKSSLMPPSGNRNDYYSLSPYWWPDPAKADGLPYIRRDGVTNPDSKKDLDRPRIAAMVDNLNALSLMYYLSGDEKYAERGAKQLRTWFVDEKTRMTPHLRYGQLVRGNPKERGSAIIDTHNFIDLVDAAILLCGSKGWTQADHEAFRSWMRAYNTWLLESPNGKDEWDAPNNHGSWYAAQTATLALFTGDSARVKSIVEEAKARIASQIKPDGSQPVELQRTRSFHYSGFNSDALTQLAEVGRWVGVDIWRYESPAGGSLKRSVDHIAEYLPKPTAWPGNQIDPVDPGLMLEILRRTSNALGISYAETLSKLDQAVVNSSRSVLLYPLK